MLKGLLNDNRQENVNSNIYPLHDHSSSTNFLSLHLAVPRKMKHKDVDSQGQLNFMKHKQATFTFKCVLSVNIRENSKTVNPYLSSLSKQVTGFSSYLAVTAFQRGCCYVQSLCNTPCAKITEVISPGWNSCPMALKPNTYS